jgi:hypothetical protein
MKHVNKISIVQFRDLGAFQDVIVSFLRQQYVVMVSSKRQIVHDLMNSVMMETL